MGLSPSILSIARGRELHGKARWPPGLQSIDLPQLCIWYTIFRELGSTSIPVKHLAMVLELDEPDIVGIAEIWEIGKDDDINVWELLMLMAATSDTLTMKTKMCFFFRMWDVDQDKKLHAAELAHLLRSLVFSLFKYCRCDPSAVPESKTITKYVMRTFKDTTSEEVFGSWAMRHRLLRTTLLAFTPESKKMVDMLDFRLSGPKVRKLNFGSNSRELTRKSFLVSSVTKIGSTNHLDEDVGEAPDSPTLKIQEMLEANKQEKALNRKSNANFALPDIGEQAEEEDSHAEEEETTGAEGQSRSQSKNEEGLPQIQQMQKVFHFHENAPANLQGAEVLLGRVRLLEEKASRMDARHRCPVHSSEIQRGRNGSHSLGVSTEWDKGEIQCGQCGQLSKHEVLLANRLWQFLKENNDMDTDAFPELLENLRQKVNMHDDMLVMTEHRNIFRLMDPDSNRMFKDAVRRIRKGLRVSFTEFLKAVCPCASNARIALFEFWHLDQHWALEDASARIFKGWRQQFEVAYAAQLSVYAGNHKNKYGSNKDGEQGDVTDYVLTVDDLVVGHVVTQDLADETLVIHDFLDYQTELNENQFLRYFCRDCVRSSYGSTFEEIMRKKFAKLAASMQKFRTPAARSETMESMDEVIRSASKASNDPDSGFSLDELLGDACLDLAFSLSDALGT